MTAQTQNDAACNPGCPVQRTADIIEHKWATLIVRDLLPGKMRYTELSRSLAGISPKVLSERLHELEAKGLIRRTVYPTVPPATDYELTELGRKLEDVIRAMAEFGQRLAQADATAPPTAGAVAAGVGATDYGSPQR